MWFLIGEEGSQPLQISTLLSSPLALIVAIFLAQIFSSQPLQISAAPQPTFFRFLAQIFAWRSDFSAVSDLPSVSEGYQPSIPDFCSGFSPKFVISKGSHPLFRSARVSRGIFWGKFTFSWAAFRYFSHSQQLQLLSDRASSLSQWIWHAARGFRNQLSEDKGFSCFFFGSTVLRQS